jgi:hypothetical protein
MPPQPAPISTNDDGIASRRIFQFNFTSRV